MPGSCDGRAFASSDGAISEEWCAQPSIRCKVSPPDRDGPTSTVTRMRVADRYCYKRGTGSHIPELEGDRVVCRSTARQERRMSQGAALPGTHCRGRWARWADQSRVQRQIRCMYPCALERLDEMRAIRRSTHGAPADERTQCPIKQNPSNETSRCRTHERRRFQCAGYPRCSNRPHMSRLPSCCLSSNCVSSQSALARQT